MPEDEKQDLDLPEDKNKDIETPDELPEGNGPADEKQEDYRGKLNATNNFLKKEGYQWDDAKKQWVKPEQAPKPDKKPDAPSQQQLSPKDAVMLAKADIDPEDIDEVIGYAAYRKISLADALKDKTLTTILSDRKEERRTARATNTGGAARGSSRPSDAQLIANAKKGIMPDSDDDMQRLIDAQLEQKRKK